jgi:hypothetical protein
MRIESDQKKVAKLNKGDRLYDDYNNRIIDSEQQLEGLMNPIDNQGNLDFKIHYFESVISPETWGGLNRDNLLDNTYRFLIHDDTSENFNLPDEWVFGDMKYGQDNAKDLWIKNRRELKKTFEEQLKFISPTGFCNTKVAHNISQLYNETGTSENTFLIDNFNELYWPLNGPNRYPIPGNYRGNMYDQEAYGWHLSGNNILTDTPTVNDKFNSNKVINDTVKDSFFGHALRFRKNDPQTPHTTPITFWWDKTYGPDISFEIKDSADINVELGEIKMVIDHIDTDKFGVDHIHAGFGVQVVDTTKSNLMGAGDALKNIMYVNNQKQMFIDGVWLGGKLLREVDGKLKWGKNTVNLTEE